MARILCLHGLGGTGRTMQPVADALTALGHTTHAPTLPGHGTTADDLIEATWAQWLQAAEEWVRDWQIDVVVGQSMGGGLALALAARRLVAKVVAINAPAPDPDAVEGLEWRLSRGHEWVDGPPLAEGEEGYTRLPTRALIEMADGVLATGLPGVTVPVLVVVSALDDVVDPDAAHLVAASLSGEVQMLVLPNSGHVASLGPDRDLLVSAIHSFV
jgi:carboxylesterase